MGEDPAEYGTDPSRAPYMGLLQLSTLARNTDGQCRGLLTVAIFRCVEALRSGRKILVCGNGGSAAMASHFVAELMGRFQGQRMNLPAIALNADTALLTALANDYGYETVFAQQVHTLGRSGDVLLALSTSGESPNVWAAVESALAMGLHVILLTGAGMQGTTASVLTIAVPSTNTQRIQELHLALLHALAAGIQDAM